MRSYAIMVAALAVAGCGEGGGGSPDGAPIEFADARVKNPPSDSGPAYAALEGDCSAEYVQTLELADGRTERITRTYALLDVSGWDAADVEVMLCGYYDTANACPTYAESCSGEAPPRHECLVQTGGELVISQKSDALRVWCGEERVVTDAEGETVSFSDRGYTSIDARLRVR